MAAIAERSQKLVAEFLARQQAGGGGNGNLDPLNIGAAFMEMTGRMMADPAKLVQAQMNLWQDYMRLWQYTAQRMMGQEAEPIATPESGDRRFKHPDRKSVGSGKGVSGRVGFGGRRNITQNRTTAPTHI